MTSTVAYSYEHPRRNRPFLMGSENRNPRSQEADVSFEVKAPGSEFRDALARLEANMSDKMNALFNRVEKCSDLSVASSRAVAALSAQFEDFKAESEQKVAALTTSLSEMRDSMNRVCSESQNLTMTALEECCNELVKQIKTHSENVNRMGDSISKVETDARTRASRLENDFASLKGEFVELDSRVQEQRKYTASVAEEMRIVAEEAVNAGLEDINRKFTKDLETFDGDWKEYRDSLHERLGSFEKRIANTEKVWTSRYDDLKTLFDERMKAEIDVRVKDTLIPNAINKVRRETENDIEEIRRLIHAIPKPSDFPETAVRNISNEIAQVQSTMTAFTNTSIPGLYREVDLKLAQSEHDVQQRLLVLLREFATEIEFDIDRMIELIHSVYVQGQLPLPPGTSSSWQRFRDVMFDRETVGGTRSRRPILGDAINQRNTPRLGSRSRTGRY
jgi:hypothetical protein